MQPSGSHIAGDATRRERRGHVIRLMNKFLFRRQFSLFLALPAHPPFSFFRRTIPFGEKVVGWRRPGEGELLCSWLGLLAGCYILNLSTLSDWPLVGFDDIFHLSDFICFQSTPRTSC